MESEKVSKVTLFNKNADCCGCGACRNVCPTDSITMKEDEYGFIYPIIDEEKCINCYRCVNTCAFQNTQEHQIPIFNYVAYERDDALLYKSASGGIFASIAKQFINEGGVVFGCSMEMEDGILSTKHVGVDKLEDLYKLQGSKYVQSDTGNIYREVLRELKNNRYVLFSGTPCQVAALKHMIKGDIAKNLITIDLICHGVPSSNLFKSYIKYIEDKNRSKILEYKFRDKANGWGCNGKMRYITKNNKIIEKLVKARRTSYYSLFLNSEIYRDSCYSCKYASCHRPGDITIGDYWGVEKEHPEIHLSIINKGISCVIINNEKGKVAFNKFGSTLEHFNTEFNKIARANDQLNKPSTSGVNRQIILDIYKNEGYAGVDKWFRRKIGLKYYAYLIWDNLPIGLKHALKKVLKR